MRQARSHAARCPHCADACAVGLSPAAAGEFKRWRSELNVPLRLALLLVAFTQFVLAIPWLFGRSLLPDAHVAASHLTRDGALGLVIAAVGLLVVWRPRYVASVLAIGVVVLVVADRRGDRRRT